MNLLIRNDSYQKLTKLAACFGFLAAIVCLSVIAVKNFFSCDDAKRALAGHRTRVKRALYLGVVFVLASTFFLLVLQPLHYRKTQATTSDPSVTYTSGSGNWTVPSGVTSVQIECWGGGADGANIQGGGGGAYATYNLTGLSAGQTCAYSVGGVGTDSWVKNPSGTIVCNAKGGSGGSGGAAASCTPSAGAYSGGAGEEGYNDYPESWGGYGGGGAGSGGNGGTPGGGAGTNPGGEGGVGAWYNRDDEIGEAGGDGTAPGGGGGGGTSYHDPQDPGGGANGQIVLTYTELAPPAAPTIEVPEALGPTSIRWNFADNSSNEDGFKVHDPDHTTVASSPTPGLTYLDEEGLSANTQYTRHVVAYNDAWDSADSLTATCYTKIQDPTGITFGTVGATSIVVSASGTLSNLTSGSSGVLLTNTTVPSNSGWTQTNSWTSISLTPNTQYYFKAQAQNGDAVMTAETGTSPKYTLSNPPINAAASDGTYTDHIHIIWNAPVVGTVNHYHVYRDGITLLPDVFGTSTDDTTTGSHTYYVYSVNDAGAESATYVSDSGYTLDVPAAPTIGTPGALGTTSIRWNFTDNSSNETGFKVHDPVHTTVVSSPTPGLTYLDETGLSANTQYTRHVHAYNAAGDSTGSATATLYTLPNTPTGAGAVAASSSQMDVSWSAGTGGVDHYHVRSSSDGYISVKYNGSGLSWSETLLGANTQYTYRIYAANADGAESGSCATASGYTLSDAPTDPVTPESPQTQTQTLATIESPSQLTGLTGKPIQVKETYAQIGDDNYLPLIISNGKVKILSGLAKTILFRVDLPDAASAVALVDGKEFSLERIAGSIFSADILISDKVGSHIVTVKKVMGDGSIIEDQVLTILVDPYGYVFDKNNNHRILNAVVLLYVKSAGGKWIKWNAKKYGQSNPQNTNRDGEYGFMVPDGKYRLSVSAPGYKDYKSAKLTIKSDLIALNIPLEPIKTSFWNDEKVIVAVLSGLLVLSFFGYILLLRKRKTAP